MRLALMLPVLVVAIPCSGQSLAELAAKEAARRAAIKEPANVITEKDLPADKTPAGRRAPVEADGARPSATPPRTSTTTKTDDNGHDERWWNARVQPLVEKLNRATRQLETARARARAISAEMQRSGTPARVAARKLQSVATEVDRRAVEVVNARRALGDLEEEARKAGALPGWLRK